MSMEGARPRRRGCGLGSGAAPTSRVARESGGGEALREWKCTGGGRSGGCAPAGRRQGAWPLFTLSQLSRFASRSGDGSAVPGPSPPPLRPGWYREDVGKWRPQPGTYTPDPQMGDTAAPAPTKRRCSPSPGSRSGPAPGSGIFPASPPSSLSSSLSLPPSHPLACACGAAPARRLSASVQTCGSLYPWALRHPLLQAKG